MSIMKMYVEEYLAAEQVAENRYIIHLSNGKEIEVTEHPVHNGNMWDWKIYHCRADEKDGCAQKIQSSAMKNYIVSQDRKSGLWYAHMRGYQHVPVSGSFSEKRRDAAEYAKMYNGLPHRVEEIERKRREAFEKEMEKA